MKKASLSIGFPGSAAALSGLLAITCASASAATPDRDPLPAGCDVAGVTPASVSSRLEPAFPPVQLEIRTPLEPSAFATAGYTLLVYELHLRNFSGQAMALRGIDIVDAGQGLAGPLATVDGARLRERMIIDEVPEAGEAPLPVGAGAVVLLCLAFREGSVVPGTLAHRVQLADAVAFGPAITTRATELKMLGPPMAGDGWIAANGLGIDQHHRPGVIVAGGLAQISRRYAVDWKKHVEGEAFAGDPLDVHAYHAYGEPVLAVADATVFLARDGIPDNTPRTPAGFSPAVALTMENVAGNAVILDLGDGQFAYYAHLAPGSVSVKTGDRVRRGQPLGRIGNSGDARWPHLHFQVTRGPDILASEGVPYVIDRFRTKSANGRWRDHAGEFPRDTDAIDFGPVPDASVE